MAFIAERFWAKVNKDGPYAYFNGQLSRCWEWTASRHKFGYGKVGINGKVLSSHVVSWTLLRGPIPEGLEIDHLCRNPPCVNPAHLEPVTHRVNILRGESPRAKHALKTHCLRGHPFSGDNLYQRAEGRYCKECRRERRRIWFRENIPRKTKRRLNQTHCINGHEMTPENLYDIAKYGQRACKLCARERSRRQHEERMAFGA